MVNATRVQLEWQAALTALQFLTRLPTPRFEWSPAAQASSIYWYGVIGGIIGVGLAGLAMLGSLYLSPEVLASLILVVWIWVTGALHLDGVADTADGWLGGATREQTLQIMHDPRCGSAGVVAIVVVLLGKWVALSDVLADPATLIQLVWVPWLARSVIPALFLTTPYVQLAGIGSGLGRAFSTGLNPARCALSVLLPLVLIALFAPANLLALALILMLLVWSGRRLMLGRLGGITGDTSGALIEVCEWGLLLALCLN